MHHNVQTGCVSEMTKIPSSAVILNVQVVALVPRVKIAWCVFDSHANTLIHYSNCIFLLRSAGVFEMGTTVSTYARQ